MMDVIQLKKAIDQYAEKVDAKLDLAHKRIEHFEKQADRYRLALEGLTPGGSEFYKNPEGCVAHIRQRLDSGDAAKKECVRLRRTNAEIRKSLDFLILDMNGDGSFLKCSACGKTWKDKERHGSGCPASFRKEC